MPLSRPAWFQEHGAGVDSGSPAGRSFYTSLGHLNETWQVSSIACAIIGPLLKTYAYINPYIGHNLYAARHGRRDLGSPIKYDQSVQ